MLLLLPDRKVSATVNKAANSEFFILFVLLFYSAMLVSKFINGGPEQIFLKKFIKSPITFSFKSHE